MGGGSSKWAIEEEANLKLKQAENQRELTTKIQKYNAEISGIKEEIRKAKEHASIKNKIMDQICSLEETKIRRENEFQMAAIALLGKNLKVDEKKEQSHLVALGQVIHSLVNMTATEIDRRTKFQNEDMKSINPRNYDV